MKSRYDSFVDFIHFLENSMNRKCFFGLMVFAVFIFNATPENSESSSDLQFEQGVLTASTYVDKPVFNAAVSQPWFIFTGGPSTGKTSVLNELKKRGHYVVAEAATDTIQKGLDSGVQAPWLEADFQIKISTLHAQREQQALQSGASRVFFDRGPLDSLCYMLFYGKQDTRNQVVDLINQGFKIGRYQAIVFFFDDLGFCENNEIRHEDQIEAQALAKQFIADYESLGFTIVRVAVASIEDRAAFIENTCALAQTSGVQ
jgi:predicted ATPase